METDSMNPISHIQARSLLDLAADQPLQADQRGSLDQHLSACDDCRRYADELRDVELTLQSSLGSHLIAPAVHLSTQEILSYIRAPQPIRYPSRLVAAPILLVMLVAIVLTMGLPRFTSELAAAQTLTATALLVPTPSAQITSTLLTMPQCESIRYQVQADDTLEAIAQKFSISKDILMAYDNLTVESLPAQLDIPLCYATPLVSSRTPASTVTITPQAEYTLRTP
jgi:hypothetical protein